MSEKKKDSMAEICLLGENTTLPLMKGNPTFLMRPHGTQSNRGEKSEGKYKKYPLPKPSSFCTRKKREKSRAITRKER